MYTYIYLLWLTYSMCMSVFVCRCIELITCVLIVIVSIHGFVL